MRKKIYLNSARDLSIMHFLWRWKIATTAMIWQKFFPNCVSSKAYERLCELSKLGYVRVRADEEGRRFVWTLDDKGFQAVKAGLNVELEEVGYKSENVRHDILVTLGHIGDHLMELPPHVEVVTEQELRRYQPEDLPDWVPYPKLHRPDGYWRFDDGQRSFVNALEVELSRKSDAWYGAVDRFYQKQKSVRRVFWIVEGRQTSTTMAKKFAGWGAGENTKHNFISRLDFENLLWETPILAGPDKSQSFKTALGPIGDLSNNFCSSNVLRCFLKKPMKLPSHEFSKSPFWGASCSNEVKYE